MTSTPITFVDQLLTIDQLAGVDQPIRDNLPAGAARWELDHTMLQFTCPCGCGRVTVVRCGEERLLGVWKWNGSIDKPSLVPAIRVVSPCRWYGFLTDGVWQRF